MPFLLLLKRRPFLCALLGFSCLATLLSTTHFEIARAAREKVHSDCDSIPARKVGLVLGCAATLSDGRKNLYFRHRVEAAAALYHAGKVQHLLVSGDNSTLGYNEARDLKNALVAKGVPTDSITCDYAGLSTLDSVVRAHRVFGETQYTVISQDFHVRRAIYIGQAHDLDLIGYAAQDVSVKWGLRTKIREQLAKVKTVLDVTLLHREPRFLGDPLPIAASQTTDPTRPALAN